MRQHPEIRAALPQRHPMLLVDRILDVEPGRSIRTVKAVTATEPCYAGLPDDAELWQYHYPESLIVESFGQSAALLWLDGQAGPADDDRTLMFVGATDIAFEDVALPGDVLTHTVRLDSVIADTAFASGETRVGDRLIARVATLVATRRPVEGSHPQKEGAR